MKLNKVICGDCLELMQTFDKESIDLIIADYPFSYFIQNKKTLKKITNEKQIDKFIESTVNEYHRILKKNGNLAIFWQSIMAYKYTKYFSDLFQVRNIVCVQDIIKWSWWFLPYNYNMLYLLSKGKRSNNWYKIDKLTDLWLEYGEGKRYSEEQLPFNVTDKILALMSKEGDVVFDSFTGTGNVVVSCKRMKRNFIGCEINPKYFYIAESRLKADNYLDDWISLKGKGCEIDG